jgi:hypothetical protein
MTNAQAAANARKPYADAIKKLNKRAEALRDQVADVLAMLDGTHPAGELADPASYARDVLRVALIAYEAHPAPQDFHCPLCGQHITDGKPCGCGAR